MPSVRLHWGLITGEYPPAPGGVADYTAQLARALAAEGDNVHVWAPAPAAAEGDGVVVHPLPGRFGRNARRRLLKELRGMETRPRLLLQYVPHAFGRKAMNLGFTRWFGRRRDWQPWVMFHEVAFPLETGQAARHRFLAHITRRMAAQVQHAAAASFVSIPAWAELLEELAPGGPPGQWLPVPSNLPVAPAPEAIAAARRELSPSPDAQLLATFGAFSEHTRSCLEHLLPGLLASDSRRTAVLIGPGSHAAAATLLRRAPALGPRLRATGFLEPADAATYLAACELAIQPYPDGVSGRRGTAMAALALALPLVTCQGRLTESVWPESRAVALAVTGKDPVEQAAALAPLVEDVLRQEARRRSLAEAGQRLYRERFSMDHTVRRLRAAACEVQA